MKKLALLPFLALGVAFISLADTALAEKHALKAQVLAQSTLEEEPESPEEFLDSEEPQSPEEFLDSLELTEEQKLQIEAILSEYRPEIETTFQERQVALEELNNVVNPNSSSDEIVEARDNFVALNRQLIDTLFYELMAVRAVLTVEQREQVREEIDRQITELVSASQTAP
jgi:Spy/CpxP family protein refolding chaperone